MVSMAPTAKSMQSSWTLSLSTHRHLASNKAQQRLSHPARVQPLVVLLIASVQLGLPGIRAAAPERLAEDGTGGLGICWPRPASSLHSVVGLKKWRTHGPAQTPESCQLPNTIFGDSLLAGPAGSLSRQHADRGITGRSSQAWHVQGQGLPHTAAPRLWAPPSLQSALVGRPRQGNCWAVLCTQQQLESGSCALQVSPCPPQPLHIALGRPTAAHNSNCTQCCLRGTSPGWLHLLQGLPRMLRRESVTAGTRHHLLQGLLPVQEQCWWLRQRRLLPPRLAAADRAPGPPLQLLQWLLPAWLPRPGQNSLLKCA